MQRRHSLLTRVDKVQGSQRSKGPQVLGVKISVTNSAAQKFQETYSADIDSDFVARGALFQA